jgi:hypothetical protein
MPLKCISPITRLDLTNGKRKPLQCTRKASYHSFQQIKPDIPTTCSVQQPHIVQAEQTSGMGFEQDFTFQWMQWASTRVKHVS